MKSNEKLKVVREALGDCRRCGLCEARNKIVFGVGSPRAALMFVGEGPGRDEDAKGEPFVGRAGKLLDKMIAAMGFERQDVYIANMVKCRPALPEQSDRAPNEGEIATCVPFLESQIVALRPTLIIALGRVAGNYLIGKEESMTRMHGRQFPYVPNVYPGILPQSDAYVEPFMTTVIPTYHPAFLLRQPTGKEYAARDLKIALKFLASKGVEPPGKPHRTLAP